MTEAPPFGSVEVLRRAFTSGLQRLLGYPGLGAYILVHANACFDREIYRILREELALRSTAWSAGT